ncbi:MAG: hypothetical protein K2X77_30740 [Candidatus Obscuribacterales bacterium]|jgi:hypothetical protein|nr:hypothetical protein [Candidatus Obscuribacterales bacterium]
MADHAEFSDTGSKQSRRQDQPEVIDGELQMTPQLEKLWNDFMDHLKEKETRAEKEKQPGGSSQSDLQKPSKEPKTVDISPYEYPGQGEDYTAAPGLNAGSKDGGLDFRPMPKDPGGLDYPDFASDPTRNNDSANHSEAHTYSELPYSITDKKPGRSYEIQEMIDTLERVEKWTDEQKAQDRQARQSAREARMNPLDLANNAIDEFNKADDKGAALERLAPQFQRAIELSDAQAKTRMKQIAGSLAISETERSSARSAREQADAMIQLNMAAIPDDQKEFVQQKLNAYEHSVTNGGKENALKEMSRVAPGLAMAIESREQVNRHTAPILAKEDSTLKNLEKATETPISVREAFAGALQQAGKTEQAEQMKKQAVDIFINVLLAQDRAKQPPPDYSREAMEEPKAPVVEWEI